MYNEVIWLRAQMAIGTHSVVGSCHVKPRLAAEVQHSGFDRFPFLTDTQVHGALHGKGAERGMITWPQGGERWSVDSSVRWLLEAASEKVTHSPSSVMGTGGGSQRGDFPNRMHFAFPTPTRLTASHAEY